MVPRVTDETHAALVGRVQSAIELQKESRHVDFKQSASWSDLQPKLVKCALSMSNLRDGGIVVIGVSQSADGFRLDGISKTHLDSFDIDDCAALINKYCSPKIDFDIVRVEVENADVLVFEFRGMEELPVVCAKEQSDWKIRRGDIWTRPKGVARCERVSTESETLEIVKLAAFSLARKMVQDSKSIGMVSGAVDDSAKLYAQERDGL